MCGLGKFCSQFALFTEKFTQSTKNLRDRQSHRLQQISCLGSLTTSIERGGCLQTTVITFIEPSAKREGQPTLPLSHETIGAFQNGLETNLTVNGKQPINNRNIKFGPKSLTR